MQTKPLKLRALEIMQGYAESPVVEVTGRNDHPQINSFQKLLGIRVGTAQRDGDPYCVAAWVYAYSKAFAERTRKRFDLEYPDVEAAFRELVRRDLMPWTASCTQFMNWARPRGLWVPAAEWKKTGPGDCVVFDFTRPGGPLSRHWGVVEQQQLLNLKTVEANTGPDADTNNDARRLGGVYRKNRPLRRWVLGYVRMPD